MTEDHTDIRRLYGKRIANVDTVLCLLESNLNAVNTRASLEGICLMDDHSSPHCYDAQKNIMSKAIARLKEAKDLIDDIDWI